MMPAVLPQPGNIARLIERSCSKAEYSLRGILFAGLEVEAIEFQEEHADHETSSLVAIDEGMVANYARCVEGRHFNNVGGVGIGIVLSWPRQGRLQ